MCDHADAGPAFRLHLVEVFQAAEVSSGVGSSGFGGLLADWVGGSHVVDAGDLQGFGALLGGGEDGQQGEQAEDEQGSHWRLLIKYRD